MNLIIESINVGLPAEIEYRGRAVPSGIGKQPVSGPVKLTAVQLEGDGQADLIHHGGADKAICAYFYDHYPYWESVMNKTLTPGAFGENFTLLGATERDVRIGDIFRTGSVRIQVSQPRVPCFKLSAKHSRPTLEEEVKSSGFTGFYFRVLTPGVVTKGDVLVLETPHPMGVTIQEANRVRHQDKDDLEALKRLLAVDALADSWRKDLSKRLQGLHRSRPDQ